MLLNSCLVDILHAMWVVHHQQFISSQRTYICSMPVYWPLNTC